MPSSPKNGEDHSVDEPIPKTQTGNNDRGLYSMLAKHSGNHLLHLIFLVHNINSWYKLGTAELFLGGKTTRMKGLPIVFDSGSTYTYFSGEAYKALYSMIMNYKLAYLPFADISFQDKIIIYDNEKQQIGWTPANCNRLPNMDDDDGDGEPKSASLCNPYGSNLGPVNILGIFFKNMNILEGILSIMIVGIAGIKRNQNNYHLFMPHKSFQHTMDSGQKIKILKGACAGFHKTNIYATLEYIILEGIQGDAGEAWIICRRIEVLEEDGCLLESANGNPTFDFRKYELVPINVIDSGKAKIGRKKEFDAALRELRGKDVDISEEADEIQDYIETLQKLPNARIFDLFQRRYLQYVNVYGLEADIWSAGMILYNLLCGVPPFLGESENVIFEEVLRVSLKVLKIWLGKCLLKTPKTNNSSWCSFLMIAWYMNAMLDQSNASMVYECYVIGLNGGHKNYRSKGSLVLKNYERQDATLLRLLSSAGGRLVISSDGVWDALSIEPALECSHGLAPESAVAAQIESTLECSRGLAPENCQSTETKNVKFALNANLI
uniref:Peptidase A1 domain-containing protein n=1 Tax=Lactuca sativa TaxID=4236 RepID=A0A9R1XUM9_LACSA|nr:hypothetical protein LSAT_V11C200085250 [Lactuca sativa]